MSVTTLRRAPSLAMVVFASLAIGFVLAIWLILGPAAGGTEAVTTGSVVIAWGIGWLLLAILSDRLARQPQRWAYVPAAFLGAVRSRTRSRECGCR